ncbi:MAG TPA: aspartate aminotransferase family protein [Terriglobia bacterium]|nr:aspartate aminotransferase family protein [Terriglobia bacterium]
MQLAHVKELESKYVLGTYARFDILVDRGSGAYLIDKSNKRYLDLLSGIGVNALGYNHPRVKQMLRKQIKRTLHISNYFYHEYQGRLAEKLCTLSGLDRAFFTNSGTESVEACLKFARAWASRARTNGEPPRHRILALENSFHGRTFGALSATSAKKYREPFEPLVPGFDFVRFNDVADLERKFTDDVCAVIVEIVQGEGGIFPISAEFYHRVRALTRERGAVFIADEIQCGLGRLGRWFAFHQFVEPTDRANLPDIIACAKPLGLGIPLGAVILKEEVASAIRPGEHGTTFGGGPLACRASLEYFRILEEDGLLEHIRETGAHFKRKLEGLRAIPIVKEVRGDGLMLAIDLTVPGKDIVRRLLDKGFIINCTHDTVLRFLPPFVITVKQIDKFIVALKAELEEAAEKPTA